MKVILYTAPGCPCCAHLRACLDAAGVGYQTVSDAQALLGLGFTHAPMLDVDGRVLDYRAALQWLKEGKENP